MISLLDRNVDRRRCMAFTLLELMIAILVMSVLMMATWNLLDIYRNQFEKNQVRVERWQLIRSLHDRLAGDLRSCSVLPSPDPVAAPTDLGFEASNGLALPYDEVTSQPAALGSSPGTASLPPVDWLQPVVGVEGTARTLVLDVVAPKLAHAARSPGDPNQPCVPDVIRRVVYVYQSPREALQAGRPPGLVRCEWTAQEVSTIGSVTSPDADLFDVLRQLQLPWLPTSGEPSLGQAADPNEEKAQPNLGLLRERLTTDVDQRIDYVPELKSFRLRYFDGQAWSDRWSYRQQASLPVAIELQIDLTDPFWLQPDDPVDPLNPPGPAAALLLGGEPTEDVVTDERLQSSLLERPQGFRRLIYLRPPAISIGFDASRSGASLLDGPSPATSAGAAMSSEALP